jgi:putative membrane protein
MPEQTLSAVRKVFRFPVLARLWPYLVAVAAYSALVVAFGRGLLLPVGIPHDRSSEAVLAGILFGWLLSFRTQAAYSRWWDGRGLWGQLVNDSRNLYLKAVAYISDRGECEKLAQLLARFAAALRDHLRLPKNAPGPHVPMTISEDVIRLIRTWQESGRIDGFAFLALDQHAQQLMNVCGAGEKIRSTPLASSYRGLLRKGITAYMILLPWLLNDDIGWLTVPIAVLLAYAVVGLELIATSIEDPFGTDGDDLKIDQIVETIRRSVIRS